MSHKVLYNLIISVFITGIWCRDLLYFDEFEYKFDLNDANDWDNYHINNDDNHNNNDVLSDVLDKKLSHSVNDKYINNLYENEQRLQKDRGFLSHLNTPSDYAQTCTKNIPLLFKQLCVHWRYDQGFKYHYQSPKDSIINDAKKEDVNWYYDDNDNDNNHDKISDAKIADKYYNELKDDTTYIGDDSNWNEINYANGLREFTLNNEENDDNYFTNFAKGGFKQCRYRVRLRECISFHLPSKTLKVNLKIARARKERNNEGFAAEEIPMNILRIEEEGGDIDDILDAAKEGILDEYEGYDEYEDVEDDDDDYDEAMRRLIADDDEDDDVMDDEDSDYYDEYDEDEDGEYEEDGDGDYDEYEDEYYGENEEDEEESAFDFHADFEFGDNTGYDNWAAEVMKWKSFKCIDCDHNKDKKRRLYDDDNEFESDYDAYGDYTYLFNDYELNFDDDTDWNEISKDGAMKCSIAIPGLEHKLCVDLRQTDHDKNGAKISFAAASDDDIDYGYYDIYGYDMYYYNIDHLYKHNEDNVIDQEMDDQSARRLITDDDDDEDNDDDKDTEQEQTEKDDEEYGEYEGYDMFGDDEFDEDYYDTQHLYEKINNEFSANLRNELSDKALHFLDDNSWNDITTIYDKSHNKFIRKCASFQTSKLCATHSISHPNQGLTFNLKIGKHKYHRSTSNKYKITHPLSARTNYINIYQTDDDNDDEMVDTASSKQQHWIISDDTLDLDDDEWDDEDLWTPSEHAILTDMLRKVVEQRCRSHTYCLCRYVDASFDGGRKHPCAAGEPHRPQRVAHVMDDFVKATPEFIPLEDYKKSPLRVEFHYKPHIEHIHVVGGLPFFHRRNHRPRTKVPWFRYARYENLRPDERPSYMPHWMWREIGAHIHHDPRQVQRIMKDLYRKGIIREKGPGDGQMVLPGGKKVDKYKGLVTRVRNWGKRTGKKITDWFNRAGNHLKKTFSAQDMDENDAYDMYQDVVDDDDDVDDESEYMYYEYDEELADELDDMNDNSDTSDMINFMWPIMQSAVKYVQPVFDAMNVYVGSGWNKLKESVGIRRRMEDGDDAGYSDYDDYDDEEEEEEDEDEEEEEDILDDWVDDEDGSNWIMLSDDLTEDDMMKFAEAELEKISKNIIGSSGKKIQRRCMNLFGRQICLCQFLEFIGINDYHKCYAKKAKPAILKMKKPSVSYRKKVIKMKKNKPIKPKKRKPMISKKNKPIKVKKNKGIKPKKSKPIKPKKGKPVKPKKNKPIKRGKKSQKKPILSLKKNKNLGKYVKKKHVKPMKSGKAKKRKKKSIKVPSKKHTVINIKKKGSGDIKKRHNEGLKGLRKTIDKDLGWSIDADKTGNAVKGLSKAIHDHLGLNRNGDRMQTNDVQNMLIKDIAELGRMGYKMKGKPRLWKPKKARNRKRRRRRKGRRKEMNGGNMKSQKEWIMKESNKIRNIVKSGMPKKRPLWIPHYFWHWLHSAPHFHVRRHKHRVPWIPSSAKDVDEGRYMKDDVDDIDDIDNAEEAMGNMYFYKYGHDVDDDDGFEEEMVDEFEDDEEMDDYDEYNNFEEGEMDENMDVFEDDAMEEDMDNYENDEDIEDMNDYDDMEQDKYAMIEDIDDELNEYNEYDDDAEDMNALENGMDFNGDPESLSDSMWRFETVFLFIFIGVLFCLMASCFVWRSKWGELIRKLNQSRIDRNKRLFQAKFNKMSILQSEDSDNSSSSLNISDVAPLNINYENHDV